MKILLPFFPRFRMGGKVETPPTTLPPNVQHYEMKNLRAGVFYHFWLTATNQKGEGEATPKVGHRVGVSSKDESVRSELAFFKSIARAFLFRENENLFSLRFPDI